MNHVGGREKNGCSRLPCAAVPPFDAGGGLVVRVTGPWEAATLPRLQGLATAPPTRTPHSPNLTYNTKSQNKT